MKYIPYGLYPKMKPRIIDDIIKDDNIIGKIAGLNMKPIRYDKEGELEEYIIGIEKLDIENFNGIYIEESRNISRESINYIENRLGLKAMSNKDTEIIHIPLVIESIYNILKESLDNKEVLVISKDKETSKKIIKEIAKVSKFITVLGCNIEDSEEIYEYILEETGLSLFNSSNIDKILGRYSIIINESDSFQMESCKIKKNAIVFNLNKENYLNCEKKNNSRVYEIKDFGFDLKDTGINSNKWLKPKINMYLYDLVNGEVPGKVKHLYIENNWYSINEYVKSFIKLKGKL